MSRPWMPLYVADYLADTGHLSTRQHGAYLLLIMHYWQKGGLPQDERALARIARLTAAEWRTDFEAIAELFEEGWRHKRIDAELAKTAKISSKRKEAGKAGAKARYGKRLANATDLPKQTEQQTHRQSQSQSHTEEQSDYEKNPAPARAREADGESEKAEASGAVACSPSDLINAIRLPVIELWALPSWVPSSRPDKQTNRSSAEIAASWIESGMTPERLRELVRPALERLKERGERPPSHLAYFASLVSDAFAEDERARTANTVVSFRTDDHEWGLRLRAWRQCGIWSGYWGEPPTDPKHCKVPKHLLTDEDRKPRDKDRRRRAMRATA